MGSASSAVSLVSPSEGVGGIAFLLACLLAMRRLRGRRSMQVACVVVGCRVWYLEEKDVLIDQSPSARGAASLALLLWGRSLY